MSNTITIEFCQEDRKRLDELIAFAGLIATEMKSRGVPVCKELEATAEKSTTPQDAPKTETPETVPTVEESNPQPESEPAAPTEEPKPTITHDMIRQKVTQLMASGDAQKKAATRDIIKSYASNVTSLPEDKWPEIWEKLTALEG